jgi:hypothetical protein
MPVINYHLGMIYYKLDKKNEARRQLQISVLDKQIFHGKEKAKKILALLTN